MPKIETFELDRWSEPDEQHRVKHIGMADAKETFDKLKAHLEQQGMLPDEYFLFSGEYGHMTGELPNFEEAVCIPNFGGSEGIYLDISLAVRDEAGKQHFKRFATGKTLGESADDYFKMFRIAAECSLMLNGRGFTYEKKDVELVLTQAEADAVGSSISRELCGYVEPEQEALLSSVLDKVCHTTYVTATFMTCHGQDDYSYWAVELPTELYEKILLEGEKTAGSLESMMERMAPDDTNSMQLFVEEPDHRFSFHTIPKDLAYLGNYSNQGCSSRGSKAEIMGELEEVLQEEAGDDGLEL